MASAFTHGFVALSFGKLMFPERMPLRFWVLSIVCTLLPDIDVVGYYFGVRYGDMLGHRGFSHSLLFALLVAVLVTVAVFPAVRRFPMPSSGFPDCRARSRSSSTRIAP